MVATRLRVRKSSCETVDVYRVPRAFREIRGMWPSANNVLVDPIFAMKI